jgi:ABC-2 type transport system ATP-binding protein
MSLEGQHLWSHHTWDAEYIPPALDGKGYLDVVIPALPLMPGTFTLNTSIVDESLSHSYDQWVKAIHFDVVQGIPRESGGVMVMNSRWENLHPADVMDLATSAPGGGRQLASADGSTEKVTGEGTGR